MNVKLDIELQKKLNNKKYDKREVILLQNTIKTLKKSISGQILRVVEKEGKVFKIVEKRATRSYRVYFILILQENNLIILDIIKKKFQNDYINKIERNLEIIFRRNN